VEFEEKGEQEFPGRADIYDLKDLPQRISLTRCEAYLEGVPGNPIYFDLILDSKVKEELVIKAVRCRFSCAYIPLQVVDWGERDEFASNGFQLRNIRPLPPLGSIGISIPFNTYACPKIPYENRWDLDGCIEFSSQLGIFMKSIGSEPTVQNVKLPHTDWLSLDRALQKLDKRGITEI